MILQELYDLSNQFQNKNGSILANGRIYVYYQGRTALAPSYSDLSGNTLNTNPVILDANGRARVYVDINYRYTMIVTDRLGKEVFSLDKVFDNGIAVGEEHVIAINGDEYIKADQQIDPETNRITYNLSLNEFAKDAVKTVTDADIGNSALNDKINQEIADRGSSDTEINNRITLELQNIENRFETVNSGLESARTEVKAGDNIEVTKTTGTDGHDIYTVNGVESVPNVSVESSDSSIIVSEIIDGNNKTFDIKLPEDSREASWGRYGYNTLDLPNNQNIKVPLTYFQGTQQVLVLGKGAYSFTVEARFETKNVSRYCPTFDGFIKIYNKYFYISPFVFDGSTTKEYFYTSTNIFTTDSNAEVSLYLRVHDGYGTYQLNNVEFVFHKIENTYSASGEGIKEVFHDSTLIGKGDETDPLRVNPEAIQKSLTAGKGIDISSSGEISLIYSSIEETQLWHS